MGRKNLEKVEETPVTTDELKEELVELIPLFGEAKQGMDILKKTCDEQNKQIKFLCKELAIDEMQVGKWKMTYSIQDRSSFDENKLLSIIKEDEMMAKLLIKTKEYVDIEALEDEIYKNNISKDVLLKIQSCKVSKEVEVLTVKEKKK